MTYQLNARIHEGTKEINMRKQKKYCFRCYEDPGHGWLKVLRKHIEALGIADKITPYSYQRGEYVYLEEDGDLSLFMDTLRKFCGHKNIVITGTHTNNQSRIRGYDCYQDTSKKTLDLSTECA